MKEGGLQTRPYGNLELRFDPDRHHRRSIRLQGFDYTQPGAYFVTICTYHRECILGDVIDGEMRLSKPGSIVSECWADLVNHYPCVTLDSFVAMPNHIHGVIQLTDVALDPTPMPARRRALPEIVRGFKTFSSRRINDSRSSPGTAVWQRNYYEHVIRDEQELEAVRHYIEGNPAKWAQDVDNPANLE